jgi:hypothetical protein
MADFDAFPVAVRPKSCPEGRCTARKHYCVTESIKTQVYLVHTRSVPWVPHRPTIASASPSEGDPVKLCYKNCFAWQWKFVYNLVALKPRNKNYNLSFGSFRPFFGEAWLRDPPKRVKLEK